MKILLALALATFLTPQEEGDLDFFTIVDPIHSLTYEKDGADITLSWELAPEITAKYLVVFRGRKGLTLLPGDTTSWTWTEDEYGPMTYTVLWCWSGFLVFDLVQATVDFGFISWDEPEGAEFLDGYYLFFGPDAESLQGPEPPEIFYDAEKNTTVSLAMLLENGTVAKGQETYVAVASYHMIHQEGNPDLPPEIPRVSELTEPIGPFKVYDRRLVIPSTSAPENIGTER
jgi:hypothetical protein